MRVMKCPTNGRLLLFSCCCYCALVVPTDIVVAASCCCTCCICSCCCYCCCYCASVVVVAIYCCCCYILLLLLLTIKYQKLYVCGEVGWLSFQWLSVERVINTNSKKKIKTKIANVLLKKMKNTEQIINIFFFFTKQSYSIFMWL